MKKLVSLTLLLSMIVCLGACSSNSSNSSSAEPSNIAETVVLGAKEALSDKDTAVAVTDKLVENPVFEDMAMVSMTVEPGFLNGFTEEINDFNDGAVIAPMIGTIPFIGYVLFSNNADDLAKTLQEKADKRWNICTEADDMACEVVNDCVIFVMAPRSFDE